MSAPCPCPRLYNTPPTHHIHNPPTTLRPTPAASSTSQQLTIRLFTLLYPLRYPLHPLHPLCSSTLPPSPSSVKSCVFLLSIAYTLPHFPFLYTDEQQRVLARRFPRRLVWPLPCSSHLLPFFSPIPCSLPLPSPTDHGDPHQRALRGDQQGPLLQGRRRCPAGDFKIRRRHSYHAHYLRLQVRRYCQHHGRREPQRSQGMFLLILS